MTCLGNTNEPTLWTSLSLSWCVEHRFSWARYGKYRSVWIIVSQDLHTILNACWGVFSRTSCWQGAHFIRPLRATVAACALKFVKLQTVSHSSHLPISFNQKRLNFQKGDSTLGFSSTVIFYPWSYGVEAVALAVSKAVMLGVRDGISRPLTVLQYCDSQIRFVRCKDMHKQILGQHTKKIPEIKGDML